LESGTEITLLSILQVPQDLSELV